MNVGVVGAGTMGAGIAQVCAAAGHQVWLYDISAEARQRGLAAIEASLARLVNKGALCEGDKGAALARVTPIDALPLLADAEVIIEAVFEDLAVKRQVWLELDGVAGAGAVLASNTSSLSITELAAVTSRPERFCGLHFFNPVPVLPLVEVVRGLRTAETTIAFARDFVTGIGKTPIACQDRPGFIVNRLLIPYLNDAVHALAEGVASAEEIDTAMKLGANMPIGPLALLDLVGLDVALAAGESLYREFGDSKFRVHPLLRQMVRAGKLGRKSGEGFFRYPPGDRS